MGFCACECDWIGSKFEDVENWQCLPIGTLRDLVGKHRKPPQVGSSMVSEQVGSIFIVCLDVFVSCNVEGEHARVFRDCLAAHHKCILAHVHRCTGRVC